MIGRRGFFGALLGGAVAGPAVLKEAVAAATGSTASSIGFAQGEFILGSGFHPMSSYSYGSSLGYEALSDISLASSARRCGCRQSYRTGHPAIDALRSVSDVHKARMERRKEIG